jgi:hypothetical protein
VFGTVVYRVVETGLPAPEKERREAGAMDGVKCEMLGGSGLSARRGMTVIDSEEAIAANVKDGVTEVVPEDKGRELVALYEGIRDAEKPSTGVVEMD